MVDRVTLHMASFWYNYIVHDCESLFSPFLIFCAHEQISSRKIDASVAAENERPSDSAIEVFPGHGGLNVICQAV